MLKISKAKPLKRELLKGALGPMSIYSEERFLRENMITGSRKEAMGEEQRAKEEEKYPEEERTAAGRLHIPVGAARRFAVGNRRWTSGLIGGNDRHIHAANTEKYRE